MKEFTIFHVLEPEDLDEFREVVDGKEESDEEVICRINKDINNYDFCYDYAETAFVEESSMTCYYHNDNIHSNPDLFIEGFLDSVESCGEEYTTKELAISSLDLKKYK